jgi:hypothetical protein
MAASDSHEDVASEVLTHINVDKSSVTRLNCKLMEKQLLDAMSELKSAKKIIDMLHDDSTGNTSRLTADQQTSAFSCEPSNSEREISTIGQASETCITVARKFSDKKRTHGRSATNN